VTLPDSYEAWRRCITVGCGIALTPAYVGARLTALTDPEEDETRRFAELYGEAHLGRVIGWFERARLELTAP
jgi:hypothetical protein